MKLPGSLSLTWLLVKILFFTVMTMQSTEIIVVAYQRF